VPFCSVLLLTSTLTSFGLSPPRKLFRRECSSEDDSSDSDDEDDDEDDDSLESDSSDEEPENSDRSMLL